MPWAAIAYKILISWRVVKSVNIFLYIANVTTDIASFRSYVTISLEPVI
jgi:hypothetical protein